MPVIAVVEDNADNRLLLQAILGDQYDLVEYENGRDALEGVRRERPALMLLDISLPEMDGTEVLAWIRGQESLKHLPVIVLTSSPEEGDRALTYDIGANSYIVKPLSFAGFLDVVRQIEGYWISLNVAPPEVTP